MNSRELTNLPVPLGRNYQHLFKTIPGFTPPADAHSVPSNPSRALTFNVNGTTQSTNNTRIDGVSTTNIWLPHVAAYVPALESLETVNVVTNSFDAEQGLAGGAAINIQIKSGRTSCAARRSSTTRTRRCGRRTTSPPRGRPRGSGATTSSAGRSAAPSSGTSCSTS